MITMNKNFNFNDIPMKYLRTSLNYFFLDGYYLDAEEVGFEVTSSSQYSILGRATSPEKCAIQALKNKNRGMTSPDPSIGCGTRFIYGPKNGNCWCEKDGKDAGFARQPNFNIYRLNKSKYINI